VYEGVSYASRMSNKPEIAYEAYDISGWNLSVSNGNDMQQLYTKSLQNSVNFFSCDPSYGSGDPILNFN
jgi:hypothetical protein